MPPLVSVVVTTYNQAPYIAAALGSVLSQTYRPCEVILVDDGSTDDTTAQVLPFRDRILYLKQPNRGVAAARNAGIARATGEFIALLDGDDLWDPTKVALQVSAALRYPTSGLVVANGVHFDGEAVLRDSLLSGPLVARLSATEAVSVSCHRDFLHRNLVATTSQVMVPREVLQAVGPSDVRLPIASDWDLYLRIAARYDVTFLPQRLTRWRYVPSSASGPLDLRALRWADDEISILRKHLRLAGPDLRPLVASLLEQKIRSSAETMYYSSRARRLPRGRRRLFKLLLKNPSSLTLARYLLGLLLPQAIVLQGARTVRRLRGL